MSPAPVGPERAVPLESTMGAGRRIQGAVPGNLADVEASSLNSGSRWKQDTAL